MTGPTGATGATGEAGGGLTAQVIGGGGLNTKGNETKTQYTGLWIDNAKDTIALMQQTVSVSGNLDNLVVRTNEGAGEGADAYEVTMMVAGAETGLSCSIVAAATICEDTGPVAITAGETIALQIKPVETPTTKPLFRWTATLGE